MRLCQLPSQGLGCNCLGLDEAALELCGRALMQAHGGAWGAVPRPSDNCSQTSSLTGDHLRIQVWGGEEGDCGASS